jgi:hypothetical protein
MGVHVLLEIFKGLKHVENVVVRLLGSIDPLLEVHEVVPILYKVGQTHAGVQFGQVDHAGARVDAVVLMLIAQIVILVRSVEV